MYNTVQIKYQNPGFCLANEQQGLVSTNEILCFQIKPAPFMAQFFPDCVIRVGFFLPNHFEFYHVYY